MATTVIDMDEVLDAVPHAATDAAPTREREPAWASELFTPPAPTRASTVPSTRPFLALTPETDGADETDTDGDETDTDIPTDDVPDTLAGRLGSASCTLSWRRLTVTATHHGTEVVLLRRLSGRVQGGFNAIMGPSGSGKSTLLNALACRVDPNSTVTGERLLNGKPYTLGDIKAAGGYVMQDDVLNPHLTVEETLRYTALLRLPPATEEATDATLEAAICQMGLLGCRRTVVGSPVQKGISGGERKRLCVAMELLSRPSLLFLDEPTSGLDSVTALNLCAELKRLAHEDGVTIICTIHQPQSKIFAFFDKLFLLKAGSYIYHGSAQHALAAYAAAGFPLPPSTNPADHLLDVITPAVGDADAAVEAATQDTVRSNVLNLRSSQHLHLHLDDAVMATTSDGTRGDGVRSASAVPPREGNASGQTPDGGAQAPRNVGSKGDGIASNANTSWLQQYCVLLRRCGKELMRRRTSLLVMLLQTIVMGLLVGGAFYQIGTDQASVRKRMPVLFFCVINQGIFAALLVLSSFPTERLVVLRERLAGMYAASPYFCANSFPVERNEAHIFVTKRIHIYDKGDCCDIQ